MPKVTTTEEEENGSRGAPAKVEERAEVTILRTEGVAAPARFV